MALAPLFWLALGVPQGPPQDAAITGREEGNRRLWRYARGLDTLTYRSVRASPATLAAEMRHARELLGTAEVELADNGLPEKATMLFPGSATAIYFTVRAIEPITTVEAEFWRRP